MKDQCENFDSLLSPLDNSLPPSRLLALFKESQEADQTKEYVGLYYESSEIQKKINTVEAYYQQAYQAITNLEELFKEIPKSGFTQNIKKELDTA